MPLINYKIVLRQAWNGVDSHNVFNYFDPNNGGNNDAEALAVHFRDEVLPQIHDFQHTGILDISLYCVNTTTGLDSSLLYLTGAGNRNVANILKSPPFNAVGFKWGVQDTQYGPASAIVKRGYNRFFGLTNDDDDNGRLSSNFMTLYGNDVVSSLLVQKSVGGATYRFCIHRPGSSWKISQVISCTGAKLTTQNSRKE